MISSIFVRSEHINFSGNFRHAHIGKQFNLILANPSFSCGNQNNTVGAPGSIDGSGRGIFQHINGFNIIGVDEGHDVECLLLISANRGGRCTTAGVVERNTINYIERLCSSKERIGSPYPDAETGTRSSIILGNIDTCEFSLDGLKNIGWAFPDQVFTGNALHGTGGICFSDASITHHDDIVQVGYLGFHDNSDVVFFTDADLRGFHSRKRN